MRGAYSMSRSTMFSSLSRIISLSPDASVGDNSRVRGFAMITVRSQAGQSIHWLSVVHWNKAFKLHFSISTLFKSIKQTLRFLHSHARIFLHILNHGSWIGNEWQTNEFTFEWKIKDEFRMNYINLKSEWRPSGKVIHYELFRTQFDPILKSIQDNIILFEGGFGESLISIQVFIHSGFIPSDSAEAFQINTMELVNSPSATTSSGRIPSTGLPSQTASET